MEESKSLAQLLTTHIQNSDMQIVWLCKRGSSGSTPKHSGMFMLLRAFKNDVH